MVLSPSLRAQSLSGDGCRRIRWRCVQNCTAQRQREATKTSLNVDERFKTEIVRIRFRAVYLTPREHRLVQ